MMDVTYIITKNNSHLKLRIIQNNQIKMRYLKKYILIFPLKSRFYCNKSSLIMDLKGRYLENNKIIQSKDWDRVDKTASVEKIRDSAIFSSQRIFVLKTGYKFINAQKSIIYLFAKSNTILAAGFFNIIFSDRSHFLSYQSKAFQQYINFMKHFGGNEMQLKIERK